MEQEAEARLRALEERLTALEARQPGLSPSTPPAGDSPFWVLEGLKAQRVDGVVFAGRVRVPGQGGVEWQYGLGTPALLGQAWDGAAPVFAALGHPARLRVLRAALAGQGRRADLAALEDIGSTGQLYHHLRELTAAGWLRPAGRGEYRVPPERVVPLLAMLAATESLDPQVGGET